MPDHHKEIAVQTFIKVSLVLVMTATQAVQIDCDGPFTHWVFMVLL